MFVNLKKNRDGSHAYQIGGYLEPGWAAVPEDFVFPEEFPYVDIEAREVTHPQSVRIEKVLTNYGVVDQEIIEPEYTQMEVISMTPGEVIEIEEPLIPSQLDVIEAQVTYTAMMTDTLLEG